MNIERSKYDGMAIVYAAATVVVTVAVVCV